MYMYVYLYMYAMLLYFLLLLLLLPSLQSAMLDQLPVILPELAQIFSKEEIA